MLDVVTPAALSETQFAALVDELAASSEPVEHRCAQLCALLDEAHPIYHQRGGAALVSMRGWILIALAQIGVTDRALPFILEELETGTDPYLVATAARALRSYPSPDAAFAPYVTRAIGQIRYRDDFVSLERYGEDAAATARTSPVRELLATIVWLGPHARAMAAEIEALRAPQGGLPKKLRGDVDRAIEAIGGAGSVAAAEADTCCAGSLGAALVSWRSSGARRSSQPVEAVVFEDHNGASITFGELCHGRPSIVAFFYTRCDNPLKCSLTITRLARVQALLTHRGAADAVQTLAISYDPAFDRPERLRGYGEQRGLRFGAAHRVLRTIDGFDTLRRHFTLGVNFIESLVNRHRLEVYVLDREGRIAASFERLHWDEQQVVDRALALLDEPDPIVERAIVNETRQASPRAISPTRAATPLLATIASLGVALFPKCPVCWAAYLSMAGVAGLERIPYSPWLEPLLAVAMLLNVASVWLRGRATGRMLGAWLAAAGAALIVVSRTAPEWQTAALAGVALTLAGSVLSALTATRRARAPGVTGLADAA